MTEDLETRIVALLSADPEPAVPLSRLHRRLAAELGPESGSYAQLQQRLAERPDLFLLVEGREPAWSTEGWPVAARLEYQEALRDAGLESGPRVALAAPGAAGAEGPAPPGLERLLRCLSSSLALLWAAAGDDSEPRGELAEAAKVAFDVRRAIALAAGR